MRILPTPRQKKILTDWFGVSRWFYNRTLDYALLVQEENGKNILRKIITKKGEEKYVSLLSFQNLRNDMRKYEFDHYVKKSPGKNNKKITFITPKTTTNNKYTNPQWCNTKVVPRIITGAIRDFANAFALQKKLVAQGLKKRFEMHYRTRKNDLQSLSLEKTCFNTNNSFLTSFLGKVRTAPIYINHIKHNFPDLKIESDCRLTYDKVKKQYYFQIPIAITIPTENQGRNPVIALDPGIRTFQTGYSPESVKEYGTYTCDRIFHYQKQINALSSQRDKLTNKRRKTTLLNVIRRKYRKIKNMVSDMHWKVIKDIVSTYKTVIIPEFRTQEMLKGMSKNNKFLLQMQSHYTFRMRLAWKSKLYNTKYHLMTEEYTSKTCTNCGTLNDVGSSKSYSCANCKIEIDRDINGARNILLKSLSN